MSRKSRYGNFTGVWGACAALLAYALVQLGVIPKTDVPFLIEALSAVLGSLAGFLHAWITDTNELQSEQD